MDLQTMLGDAGVSDYAEYVLTHTMVIYDLTYEHVCSDC